MHRYRIHRFTMYRCIIYTCILCSVIKYTGIQYKAKTGTGHSWLLFVDCLSRKLVSSVKASKPSAGTSTGKTYQNIKKFLSFDKGFIRLHFSRLPYITSLWFQCNSRISFYLGNIYLSCATIPTSTFTSLGMHQSKYRKKQAASSARTTQRESLITRKQNSFAQKDYEKWWASYKKECQPL